MTPRVMMLVQKLALTACVALAAALSTPLVAQSNVDGAISGKAPGAGTVTVENTETGTRRVVTVGADGGFRATALPPGVYNVTYTDTAGATRSDQVMVVINTTTSPDFSDDTIALGEMQITATPINPIDFGKVESVTIMTEKQLDTLPVARTNYAVALLAPGTTRGDTAFGDNGNLVSFGGASVAENQFFINGMNVSNFRNGLDPAQLPFESYSQFEVLTGGYSVQYGRSTGGVVATTTKSGTNEFHAGVNLYFEPDALRAKAPDSYFLDTGDIRTPYIYNKADYTESFEGNIYASGPILKDKLFFYGIYNVRNVKDDDAQATLGTFDRSKTDDPFWLIKIDAVPFDGHRLEYTGFSDKRTRTFYTTSYDFDTDEKGTEYSQAWEYRGGKTHIARYTGVLADGLTVSALYGESKQDRRTLSETDSQPLVLDARSGSVLQLAGNTSSTGVIDALSLDTRKAMRLDVEYAFSFVGDHRIRVGLDREDNESLGDSAYAAPAETGYWRYIVARDNPNTGAPATINGVVVPNGTEGARFRILSNSGAFEVKSEAYYIEDNWSLMENRLNLRLGIRNERFENLNANGETFIKMTNQWAPRVGASFDVFGNQKTKVFFNYGRYHLPVASNTNLRLAGGELFTEEWYYLNGLQADGYSPNLGAKIGDTTVLSNGEVPDTRTVVDTTIKPMYQDELILGIQHQLTKSITVGMRAIHRELGTAMDDMIVDHALIAWGNRNGYEEYTEDLVELFHYVLGNPGKDMQTAWDFDGDGVLEDVLLTKEDLMFPKAKRKYYSAEFFAEKVWDGKWTAQFSYTWAHSYGNSEGWVLSDNGQDDAGITLLFDTPDLTANSYGNLPNDVRHQFKLFGAYALTPELTLGANTYVKSGRPINYLVNVEDSVVGSAYGNDYFGQPRGTAGETSWVVNLDLSLRWSPKSLGAFLSDRCTFQVDVFNVLNRQSVTEVYERAEEDQLINTANPRYRIPTSWQSPRYVRFSVGIEY